MTIIFSNNMYFLHSVIVVFLVSKFFTISQPGIINDSPYCLPYNSSDVSPENLVMDPLLNPFLIFFFILITSLLDVALIW